MASGERVGQGILVVGENEGNERKGSIYLFINELSIYVIKLTNGFINLESQEHPVFAPPSATSAKKDFNTI